MLNIKTMPTPLEILLDPVSLLFTGIYSLLMLWEGIFPARKLPHVRFWRAKGIASYVFFLLLSSYLPLAYATWLPSSALLDLSSMNIVVAALVGILVYELGIYVWHRLMHSKDLLWRVFHQMHHSAERLDTYGAFFFSPMDMIGFTVLGSLSISVLVGMPPTSITIFLLVTNFLNVFQHANIKTPVWLGYLIQRPESHSIHHAKGVHAFNYSDLPIFDILFGTFKNPSGFALETGFFEGASAKVKDMLRFKDISKVKVSSKTTTLILALLVMLTAQVTAQTSRVCVAPNNFEIGFNMSQYQKDFGVGLHFRSPYFIMKSVAIKVGANLQWLENFNGTETTSTTYQNFQLGVRGRSVMVSENIFVYGEGGILTILPNSDFSSQRFISGGYGLFGFEFKPIPKFGYFIELGGVGTGATADRIESKPVYSNGFLTNVGLRIGF
jgi:sterol desaturase/sphingolipid hydroxylase (fatty acid hydroxylase superfamily)